MDEYVRKNSSTCGNSVVLSMRWRRCCSPEANSLWGQKLLAGETTWIIDFRESLSSIALLKVTQIFGRMDSAEILEIRGAGVETREDLFKVLPRASFDIVEFIDHNATSEYPLLRLKKRV